MSRNKNDVEPEVKAPKAATLETFESVTLSLPRNELGSLRLGEYSYYQVATVDDIQSLVTAARLRFGCAGAVKVRLAAGSVTVSRKSES